MIAVLCCVDCSVRGVTEVGRTEREGTEVNQCHKRLHKVGVFWAPDYDHAIFNIYTHPVCYCVFECV